MVGGSGEISRLPPTIFVMITNQKWQLYRTLGATHPISSMPRGSAPIIPRGSAFRICLFHRQIHGSRRRARARWIVLQYSCPHKKVSFGWPFCVDEGTPGAQHPISYMPLISRKKILHQNCKNNAILVQCWFCILPDARNQNGRSSVSAPAASKSVGAGAGAWDG